MSAPTDGTDTGAFLHERKAPGSDARDLRDLHRRYIIEYGSQLARYADIAVQFAEIEDDPGVYYATMQARMTLNFILDCVRRLREENERLNKAPSPGADK